MIKYTWTSLKIIICLFVIDTVKNYKNPEIIIENAITYLIAISCILITTCLAEGYVIIEKWVDKNPQHFDSFLWLNIPALMSIVVIIECYARNTQKPITAMIMYYLIIAFWDNIIAAIDRWVPEQLEPILKLGLAPILVPVSILQALGVLQKKYYAPFFKKSRQ